MNTEHGRSNGKKSAIGWDQIEQHLVGLSDLDELISRLSKDQPGQPGPSLSIAEVLGSHRQEILEHGLARAADETLEGLLGQPELLRNLQWLVFAYGGEYWAKRIDQAAACSPQAT